MESERRWHQLEKVDNYHSFHKMDNLRLSVLLQQCRFYDVSIGGNFFDLCEVSVVTHTTRGSGGMSEDTSTEDVFAKTQLGFTILLEAGDAKLRAVPKAHKSYMEKVRKQQEKEELEKLRAERAAIDSRLRELGDKFV